MVFTAHDLRMREAEIELRGVVRSVVGECVWLDTKSGRMCVARSVCRVEEHRDE